MIKNFKNSTIYLIQTENHFSRYHRLKIVKLRILLEKSFRFFVDKRFFIEEYASFIDFRIKDIRFVVPKNDSLLKT